MSENYQFTEQLAGNSKRLKLAFLSLTIFVILCIGGIILSKIFWDDYTHVAYSLKYQTNVVVGWPAFVSGWAWWFVVGTLLMMPFIYFMQDWKNPSLALTSRELFINQQLIRNSFIPFSNIKGVTKEGDSYTITFVDSKQVVDQQVFLFKPFVKHNLENNNFFITSMYSVGDIDGFMKSLETKIGKS
jgi:hypothetical protein